jgi:galactitol-specific phosphotransferase system IIB component
MLGAIVRISFLLPTLSKAASTQPIISNEFEPISYTEPIRQHSPISVAKKRPPTNTGITNEWNKNDFIELLEQSVFNEAIIDIIPKIAHKLNDESIMRVLKKLLPKYEELLVSGPLANQDHAQTVTKSIVEIVKSIKSERACLDLLVPVMMIDSKLNSDQSPAKEIIKAIIQKSDPMKLNQKLVEILESDRLDHKISWQTKLETNEEALSSIRKKIKSSREETHKETQNQAYWYFTQWLTKLILAVLFSKAIQYYQNSHQPNGTDDGINQPKPKAKAKPKAKPKAKSEAKSEPNISNFNPNTSVLVIDPTNKKYTIIEKETFSKKYVGYCNLYVEDSIFWVNDAMLMPLSITFDKIMNNTDDQTLSKNQYDALLLSEQPDVLQTSTRCKTPAIIMDLYNELGLSQALPNGKTKKTGADELNTSRKLDQVANFIFTKFNKNIEDINALLKEKETKKSFDKNDDYNTRLDALKTYISYLETNNHNDMKQLETKLSEIDTILNNMYINPNKYRDTLIQSDNQCVTILDRANYTSSNDLSIDPKSEEAIKQLLQEDRLLDLLGLLFDLNESPSNTVNYLDKLSKTDRSLICSCFGWNCANKEAFRNNIIAMISEKRKIEFDFIVSANSKPVNLEVKAWNLLNKDRSHNEQKIALFIQRIKNQLKKQSGYFNSHCVFISDRTSPLDIEQERKALQIVANNCNLTIKALKKSDIDSQTKLEAIIKTASEESTTLFIISKNDIKSAIERPDGAEFQTVLNSNKFSKKNAPKRGEDAERLLRELFSTNTIDATSGLVFTDTDTAMSSGTGR